MISTPTKTCKRTSPLYSKLCCFCDTNLELIYGKIIPSVPIFKKSSNKEFNLKDFCLNDHLKRNVLTLDQNGSLSKSLCRKCARKVLTTVKSFLFIQNSVNKTVDRKDKTITSKYWYKKKTESSFKSCIWCTWHILHRSIFQQSIERSNFIYKE